MVYHWPNRRVYHSLTTHFPSVIVYIPRFHEIKPQRKKSQSLPSFGKCVKTCREQTSAIPPMKSNPLLPAFPTHHILKRTKEKNFCQTNKQASMIFYCFFVLRFEDVPAPLIVGLPMCCSTISGHAALLRPTQSPQHSTPESRTRTKHCSKVFTRAREGK